MRHTKKQTAVTTRKYTVTIKRPHRIVTVHLPVRMAEKINSLDSLHPQTLGWDVYRLTKDYLPEACAEWVEGRLAANERKPIAPAAFPMEEHDWQAVVDFTTEHKIDLRGWILATLEIRLAQIRRFEKKKALAS